MFSCPEIIGGGGWLIICIPCRSIFASSVQLHTFARKLNTHCIGVSRLKNSKLKPQVHRLDFNFGFDTENFAFHGPDGFDSDYAGLTEYFRSIRAAFEDRTIRRGIIVAEGDLIACQTWIEGTFTGPFTHSPAGKLAPNGARVVWDLMSMFRFDDRGRLVEEFVRTDNRSFLRQLGAEAA